MIGNYVKAINTYDEDEVVNKWYVETVDIFDDVDFQLTFDTREEAEKFYKECEARKFDVLCYNNLLQAF